MQLREIGRAETTHAVAEGELAHNGIVIGNCNQNKTGKRMRQPHVRQRQRIFPFESKQQWKGQEC